MAYKKYREMKVYEASGYQYKRTPSIVLKGQWLSELGFDIGEQIEVKCEDGRLIKRMDYLSSAEIAKKWNVSQRRVAVFCKEGRVKGAVLIGRMWMIPKDAEKPIDPRRIMNKEEDLSDIINDGGKENG